MSTRTARLMQRTRQPVRRQVTRGLHYDYVWASYLKSRKEMIERHPSTIDRHTDGETLPSWGVLTYYAEKGTRCPGKMKDDLHDYFWLHYRSRAAAEGLRAALMLTLAEIPPEDREDILDYCGDSDLPRLWAVLTWYCLCCDYSDRFWTSGVER